MIKLTLMFLVTIALVFGLTQVILIILDKFERKGKRQ